MAFGLTSLQAQQAAYYLFETVNGGEGAVYAPLAAATALTGPDALTGAVFDDYAFVSATEVKASTQLILLSVSRIYLQIR